MKRLTVLYDANCGFCVRCRWWMARQPKYLELEFLPAGGPDARRRYPDLWLLGEGEELVAVGDDSSIYRSTNAWLMCLYALEEYREWAERLAQPALRPLARGLFELVSNNRKRLSCLLGLKGDGEVIDELRRATPPVCSVDGS